MIDGRSGPRSIEPLVIPRGFTDRRRMSSDAACKTLLVVSTNLVESSLQPAYVVVASSLKDNEYAGTSTVVVALAVPYQHCYT